MKLLIFKKFIKVISLYHFFNWPTLNIYIQNFSTNIQKNNKYDDYEIKSNRAEWKDILSVYSVIVSNGEETNILL